MDFAKVFVGLRRKHGIVQSIIIANQLFNQIPTYCVKCKERITFKVVKGDGSYTRLCKCGCRLLQSHDVDKFHKTRFFTEKFISCNSYEPNKDDLERLGFKKTERNGKIVYEKEGTGKRD